MTEETKLYSLVEESTAGYHVLKKGMTREECERQWYAYVREGLNPNYIKIVRDA